MTAAGTILNNRYKILGLLSGQGGMGVVYQATDLNLLDTVVIKQSRFNDEAFMRQKFPDLKGAALRSQSECLRKAAPFKSGNFWRMKASSLKRDCLMTTVSSRFRSVA